MKNVVIVGAGRLGKGFVGETFDQAGWNITFLDKDRKVIDALNQSGEYRVKVHRVEEIQNRVISGYQAYVCDEQYACMGAVLEADLMVLPLYPEDFAEAGRYLAPCLEEFYKIHPERKLTMICITNKNYLIPEIENGFKKYLTKSSRYKYEKNV